MANGLFRHYKGQLYSFRAIAKHSETLEELVVYDCLYPNPAGQHWVRPKDMFFGKVMHAGASVPRFGPADLRIEEHSSLGATHLAAVGQIAELVVDPVEPENLRKRLQAKCHLGLAYLENELIGFKLGYELSEQEFYSWLGGVRKEYRGLGAARALMDQQHDWCRRQGYARVRTKSQNRYREMLRLNLAAGFDVVNMETDPAGQIKVVLEKIL